MKSVAVVVVLAVVAASCGDSNETGGAASTVATPSTTTAPATAMTEPALLVSPVDRSEPIVSAPVEELASGFNQAGYALWLAEAPDDNFVLSPLSIGHGLLMARAAADETTGGSIDTAFGLPDALAAHEAWNALDAELAKAAEWDEIKLILADRIWPDLSASPDQGWVDLLAAEHGASSQVLDLRGDPDASVDMINGWVSEQTQGLIEDLLDPSFLNPSTVLVLTDAIYFEAKWQTQFGKYGEVTAPFVKVDGTSVDTSYLVERELDDLRGAGDGWVAAEIPYQGLGYSMLVIIPDHGRFADLRSQLAMDLVDEIDAQMTLGPYELRLPKWEAESRTDLLPWLQKSGVAPGSYPLIAPGASIGAAIHAANIAVDDVGTIAAAATALGFTFSGPQEPELDVFADQPFLYLVRHRRTGVILFAGQVVDPTV